MTVGTFFCHSEGAKRPKESFSVILPRCSENKNETERRITAARAVGEVAKRKNPTGERAERVKCVLAVRQPQDSVYFFEIFRDKPA